MEERNGPQPLTARSVVASTLLAEHPPRLPARALVRSGEAFGIAEGTIRVALSRMVLAGELAGDGGMYELVGHLAERQRRQDVSRRGLDAHATWDGDWRVAVVLPGGRAAGERATLRSAMLRARMGELRDGVWARPDNLPASLDLSPIDSPLEWFSARPDVSRRVVARLWDLERWAARGRQLRDEMRSSPPRGVEPGELAAAFTLDAAVLRHLQADPLLPHELLPHRWPGTALRATYERYDTAFRRAWLNWQRAKPRGSPPR